jgi:hypothetical protein
MDMAAAGVPLKQIDSRAVAVAAGYEADLADLAGCGKTAVLNEIRNPNYAGFKTDAVWTAFKAHKCL